MLQALQAKKLVSVLATSLLMTSASTETLKVKVLNKVSCICYLVQFCKNKGRDILALFNFESEVNIIIPAYTAHLGLTMRMTDIGVQKIDGSLLGTYGMVIAAF